MYITLAVVLIMLGIVIPLLSVALLVKKVGKETDELIKYMKESEIKTVKYIKLNMYKGEVK